MIECFPSPDDWLLDAEDELQNLAEELPELSAELRQQVVQASQAAHKTSHFWQRVQMGVVVLVLVVAGATLNGYYSSLLQSRLMTRPASPGKDQVSRLLGDPAHDILDRARSLATPSEWALVDASMASRHYTSRVIQFSLVK